MNSKIKKFSIFMLLFIIAFGCLAIPGAKSKTKSYYNGDAINYNGKVIVGSTNMNGLEIFKLENNVLFRMVRIRSFNAQYGGNDDFYSIAFNIEDGILYAYAVDGRYIYKYDLSSLSSPKLVKQIKDNSWDWFRKITVSNGRIVTIGNNGVKIWNTDMQVIDAHKIKTENFNNINISKDGKYIFVGEKNLLKIYSTTGRNYIANIEIANADNHNITPYFDTLENLLYVADDKSVKKYNLNGDILKSFPHTSQVGYDVVLSNDKNYVYFTDGIGIVKLTNKHLIPVKWIYASQLKENGGWAMGLKVVNDGESDQVIDFNSSSITALDGNLKYISHYKSHEEDNSPIEKLFLNADKTRAPSNSLISLRGGGYAANEDLTITFAGARFSAVSDVNGRFSTILTVPAVKAGGNDIKVTGNVSGQSYSLGFYIE